MIFKRFFQILPLFVIAIVVIIYFCNRVIAQYAKNKLYSNTKDIPFNRIGLLLGTSPFSPNGYRNTFYTNRIRAAVELIKAGKIKYLIISGDNHRRGYNEPESMRTDLINAGIDSNIIYLDYAGFRTYDSVIRLKEIFNQDTVTIISQPFHDERAIYIASRLGISAIGYNAKDVNTSAGLHTMLREKFARVKVFLDFWFGTKPKFLGDKVVIPG